MDSLPAPVGHALCDRCGSSAGELKSVDVVLLQGSWLGRCDSCGLRTAERDGVRNPVSTCKPCGLPYPVSSDGESGRCGDASTLWVIDPLDGTSNYLHGLPHFAVSIAQQVNGRTEHGVIFDPMREELFTASRGGGAYLNNKRIRVSNRITLDEAILATAFPFRSREHLPAYGRIFQSIFEKCTSRFH